MFTFKEFVLEDKPPSLNGRVNMWLKRDQSSEEMNDRSKIHSEVLNHFSDDEIGNNRLAKSVKQNSNATWTLAQHMEHHPEFQSRVLSHLEKGQNPGDKMRANFLRDRMDVNNQLRKTNPDQFNNIRDNNKKYDSKTKSFVPATDKDVMPGHPDFKPPTSPEEAYKRISDPNHVEHNPHLTAAIDAVKKTRPAGYRFTQPSFAVNSNEWFKDK